MAATAAAMSPPSRAVRVTASSTPATRRRRARPSSADTAILWSSPLRARRSARPTSEANIEIAASVRVTSSSRRVATRITRRRPGRICRNARAAVRTPSRTSCAMRGPYAFSTSTIVAPVSRTRSILSRRASRDRLPTRGAGSLGPREAALAGMGPLREQRALPIPRRSAQAGVEVDNHGRLSCHHRLGRHAQGGAEARDDDPTRAHLAREPVQKHRPVGQADSLPLEPEAELNA